MELSATLQLRVTTTVTVIRTPSVGRLCQASRFISTYFSFSHSISQTDRNPSFSTSRHSLSASRCRFRTLCITVYVYIFLMPGKFGNVLKSRDYTAYKRVSTSSFRTKSFLIKPQGNTNILRNAVHSASTSQFNCDIIVWPMHCIAALDRI